MYMYMTNLRRIWSGRGRLVAKLRPPLPAGQAPFLLYELPFRSNDLFRIRSNMQSVLTHTQGGDFDSLSKPPHFLSSSGPPSGEIVSNLLQFISEASPSVSPRWHATTNSAAATAHRTGAAACAAPVGTLLPFSTGWGALHPAEVVKQRPAALRSVRTDANHEAVQAAAGVASRCRSTLLEKGFAQRGSPRRSLEVRPPRVLPIS
jgi:hypothetical protein